MPTYEKGNMWDAYDETDLMLVTANSTIKSSGAIVMGRGAAREARDYFPGIDLAYGQLLYLMDVGNYGIMTPTMMTIWSAKSEWVIPHIALPLTVTSFKVGLFQVKRHFKDKADLGLINRSVDDLLAYIEVRPGIERVDMNFPGIGNGRLDKALVKPRLWKLPDYVHIWTKE